MADLNTITRYRGHFVLDRRHGVTEKSPEQSILETSIKCSQLSDASRNRLEIIKRQTSRLRYRIRLAYEYDTNMEKLKGSPSSSVELLSPQGAHRPTKVLKELKPVLRNLVERLIDSHHRERLISTTKPKAMQPGQKLRPQSVDSARIIFEWNQKQCRIRDAVLLDRNIYTNDLVHQRVCSKSVPLKMIPSPVVIEVPQYAAVIDPGRNSRPDSSSDKLSHVGSPKLSLTVERSGVPNQLALTDVFTYAPILGVHALDQKSKLFTFASSSSRYSSQSFTDDHIQFVATQCFDETWIQLLFSDHNLIEHQLARVLVEGSYGYHECLLLHSTLPCAHPSQLTESGGDRCELIFNPHPIEDMMHNLERVKLDENVTSICLVHPAPMYTSLVPTRPAEKGSNTYSSDATSYSTNGSIRNRSHRPRHATTRFVPSPVSQSTTTSISMPLQTLTLRPCGNISIRSARAHLCVSADNTQPIGYKQSRRYQSTGLKFRKRSFSSFKEGEPVKVTYVPYLNWEAVRVTRTRKDVIVVRSPCHYSLFDSYTSDWIETNTNSNSSKMLHTNVYCTCEPPSSMKARRALRCDEYWWRCLSNRRYACRCDSTESSKTQSLGKSLIIQLNAPLKHRRRSFRRLRPKHRPPCSHNLRSCDIMEGTIKICFELEPGEYALYKCTCPVQVSPKEQKEENKEIFGLLPTPENLTENNSADSNSIGSTNEVSCGRQFLRSSSTHSPRCPGTYHASRKSCSQIPVMLFEELVIHSIVQSGFKIKVSRYKLDSYWKYFSESLAVQRLWNILNDHMRSGLDFHPSNNETNSPIGSLTILNIPLRKRKLLSSKSNKSDSANNIVRKGSPGKDRTGVLREGLGERLCRLHRHDAENTVCLLEHIIEWLRSDKWQFVYQISACQYYAFVAVNESISIIDELPGRIRSVGSSPVFDFNCSECLFGTSSITELTELSISKQSNLLKSLVPTNKISRYSGYADEAVKPPTISTSCTIKTDRESPSMTELSESEVLNPPVMVDFQQKCSPDSEHCLAYESSLTPILPSYIRNEDGQRVSEVETRMDEQLAERSASGPMSDEQTQQDTTAYSDMSDQAPSHVDINGIELSVFPLSLPVGQIDRSTSATHNIGKQSSFFRYANVLISASPMNKRNRNLESSLNGNHVQITPIVEPILRINPQFGESKIAEQDEFDTSDGTEAVDLRSHCFSAQTLEPLKTSNNDHTILCAAHKQSCVVTLRDHIDKGCERVDPTFKFCYDQPSEPTEERHFDSSSSFDSRVNAISTEIWNPKNAFSTNNSNSTIIEQQDAAFSSRPSMLNSDTTQELLSLTSTMVEPSLFSSEQSISSTTSVSSITVRAAINPSLVAPDIQSVLKIDPNMGAVLLTDEPNYPMKVQEIDECSNSSVYLSITSEDTGTRSAPGNLWLDRNRQLFTWHDQLTVDSLSCLTKDHEGGDTGLPLTSLCVGNTILSSSEYISAASSVQVSMGNPGSRLSCETYKGSREAYKPVVVQMHQSVLGFEESPSESYLNGSSPFSSAPVHEPMYESFLPELAYSLTGSNCPQSIVDTKPGTPLESPLSVIPSPNRFSMLIDELCCSPSSLVISTFQHCQCIYLTVCSFYTENIFLSTNQTSDRPVSHTIESIVIPDDPQDSGITRTRMGRIKRSLVFIPPLYSVYPISIRVKCMMYLTQTHSQIIQSVTGFLHTLRLMHAQYGSIPFDDHRTASHTFTPRTRVSVKVLSDVPQAELVNLLHARCLPEKSWVSQRHKNPRDTWEVSHISESPGLADFFTRLSSMNIENSYSDRQGNNAHLVGSNGDRLRPPPMGDGGRSAVNLGTPVKQFLRQNTSKVRLRRSKQKLHEPRMSSRSSKHRAPKYASSEKRKIVPNSLVKESPNRESNMQRNNSDLQPVTCDPFFDEVDRTCTEQKVRRHLQARSLHNRFKSNRNELTSRKFNN